MSRHAGRKSRNAVAGEVRKSKPPASRGNPVMQQDPFADVDEMLMSRATDTPSLEKSFAPARSAPASGAAIPAGKVVCPFCGSVNDRPSHDYDNSACPKCTMSDNPATRQATRARLGPWFVRQNRNPAAPGMKFDTLMGLVKRGQVTSQSVVRGPTTNQFWRFAAQVKGLSREFGACYNCATPIDAAATICPQCNRMQEPPSNPDVLLENAPTAAAATAPASSPATVHREIKPPTPAPAPTAATVPSPAFAPAAPATAQELQASSFAQPQRSASAGRRERAPARDEAPQRTDALALSRPRPQPKQRLADDGILSARDLATAFQLDFTPDARRGSGAIRRVMVVGLLLAVSGGAITLMAKPSYRDGVRLWVSERSTALGGAVTGRPTPLPRPPAVASAGDEMTKTTSAVAVPATQPSPEAKFPLPPRPPEPRFPQPQFPESQFQVSVDNSQVQSAPQTQGAADSEFDAMTPSPAPRVTMAPVPVDPATSQPAAQNPQPQQLTKDQPVAKVAAAPVDAAKASEQAITLWRQALDAEGRRDYAKAVEHYQAIKKLPRSTWPAGLEINLEYATKRVK